MAKPMIVTAAAVRMKVMIVAGVAKRSLAGSAQTSSVLGSTPSAGMTIAGHDVLGRGHLRESERSACMELLGGDADLRTEAELAPVGEARGGVDHPRGRVHGCAEPPSRGLGTRHDRLGVARGVPPDVGERRVEVRYDGR